MFKKTIYHKLLFLLFAPLFFVCCASEAFGSSCSPSSYMIAYINGINTLKRDARLDATRVLTPAIGKIYNGEGIKIILAYNKTKDLHSDLADVFKQKLNEYPQVRSDLIFKAITRGVFGNAIPRALQDFVSQYHINKIKDHGYVSYSDDDLKDIIGTIRSNVVENQKILLVPHSQGNLYANAAYAKLTTGNDAIPTTAIGIMGIASPAAYVAGNGDYVTSSNDLVIGGLRLLGLTVLNSNITISLTTDDLLGHGLKEVYFNTGLAGKAEILRKIRASLSSLVSPGGTGSQGPITVTLSWGSQPDVDLHIFEPDGTHVYYSSRTGHVGYLDIDVTNSYGPEHYFTSCSTLKTGNYIIGVNYFNGSGTETASVTISTPLSSITRQVTFTTAAGASGNNNPVIMGTVKVTKSADGKYKYEII